MSTCRTFRTFYRMVTVRSHTYCRVVSAGRGQCRCQRAGCSKCSAVAGIRARLSRNCNNKDMVCHSRFASGWNAFTLSVTFIMERCVIIAIVCIRTYLRGMVIVRLMLANFHTVSAVIVLSTTIIVNGTTNTSMKSRKLNIAAWSCNGKGRGEWEQTLKGQWDHCYAFEYLPVVIRPWQGN